MRILTAFLVLFLFALANGNPADTLPETIEANLKAGAEAARAALVRPPDSPATLIAAQTQREARRQAYLRAEANELAARQRILARLVKAKTNEEADEALAEIQDRWQAAEKELRRLKEEADAAEVESDVTAAPDSAEN